MEKISRKIFQPDYLTSLLLDEAGSQSGKNLSELINSAIKTYFLPIIPEFRKEIQFLFTRIEKKENISDQMLKAILSRCVGYLKKHPIEDPTVLEQVFIHFLNNGPRKLRYDYVQIVDTQQDAILHRLNDILATIDSDFTLGMREFGERSRYVFNHWNEVCQYSEIYTALSTLIDLESIYYPLDTFRTIDLIKSMDTAANRSNLTAIKDGFVAKISTNDRFYGIKYEISVYMTDSGYAELSGDHGFIKMPAEINDYLLRYMKVCSLFGEASEDDVNRIAEFEREGRRLFRRLKHNSER